mmetsp:Transcript_24506/g.33465  ORF Transcript_24506/g.33465 Transcript_24506/m.33465 type:complete len:175 (+) Transcript_24506:1269-1793(+)
MRHGKSRALARCAGLTAPTSRPPRLAASTELEDQLRELPCSRALPGTRRCACPVPHSSPASVFSSIRFNSVGPPAGHVAGALPSAHSGLRVLVKLVWISIVLPIDSHLFALTASKGCQWSLAAAPCGCAAKSELRSAYVARLGVAISSTVPHARPASAAWALTHVRLPTLPRMG